MGQGVGGLEESKKDKDNMGEREITVLLSSYYTDNY